MDNMGSFTLHEELLKTLVSDVHYIWYYNELDEIAVVIDTNTETFDVMFFSWTSYKWNYGFSLSLSDGTKALQIVKLISNSKCDKSDLPF